MAVAREHDVAMLPGALTPTEVLQARSLGGDIIKIFPAGAVGGAAYLKALRGPFPDIELCPTGGVNLETLASYFEAGAAAVGVGGELVLKSAIETGEFERITELARRYVDAVAAARR
jgi:2-dehydro-3-deoxyphosphogluconate aldolase/(4S)-4-hydroxy-2-oxoglutarate aldolase